MQWIFTFHNASSMNFYCVTKNNRLKHAIYQISSETANRVQSNYFRIKFLSYVQNVHHRPTRVRLKFMKVVNSFVDHCPRQVITDRSAAVHFLAPESSWALGEIRELPEALHPAHDSQVGWGLVNLVAIHPLRWSRYSEKWKFTRWLHLIWHTSVKFKDKR